MPENYIPAFPRNEIEALALLYVQKFDRTDPATMLDLYQKAYDQIQSRYQETYCERNRPGWSQK